MVVLAAEAAKKLVCENVHLTVIDRPIIIFFSRLLYQVATAALSPADIAAPIRAVLQSAQECRSHASGSSIGRREHAGLVHGDLNVQYDYLILATGARHSYFGHPEWERLAPGLKSLEDAVEIRRRIFAGV